MKTEIVTVDLCSSCINEFEYEHDGVQKLSDFVGAPCVGFSSEEDPHFAVCDSCSEGLPGDVYETKVVHKKLIHEDLLGITYDMVESSFVNEYTMTLNNQDAECVFSAVQKGIDEHLESINFKIDYKLECGIRRTQVSLNGPSLCVLLRRLCSSGERSLSLALDILQDLGLISEDFYPC